MDYLSLIKSPIHEELNDFVTLFNRSLKHENGLLSRVLEHIRQRGGKRMRPMLTLLMAKNFGIVSEVTQYAAIGLELLHTASLVHDDVVDESNKRRGQASVNALFDNKVSVLVGDYILSTALLSVSYTHSELIVRYLSELGRTLSDGEILQLSNIDNTQISEEAYYEIIKKKTAVLFEMCAVIGAVSAGASDDEVVAARQFGQDLGIIFQIRDDIFDYYDETEVGKPTGNDMLEGKLTLPVIYALQSTGDEAMLALAHKVKQQEVNAAEIASLVAFTKAHGGIEYAEQQMAKRHAACMQFIDERVGNAAIKTALTAYLDYVIARKS